jgi:hypothetical protein
MSSFSGFFFARVSPEMVYLTDNHVHGTIPSSLGQLTRLKRMQLSRNNIQGNVPPQLGLLHQHLEVLSVGHNNMSGTIPSQLGLLTNLMELNLAGNAFTGAIPSELNQLQELTILRLEENNVTGSIPPSMCNITASDGVNKTGVQISVDCEQVQCSCCADCCYFCGLGEMGISLDDGDKSVSTVAVSSPTTSPTMDPLIYPVSPTRATNFDCYSIEVGFTCYGSYFSIDFEASICNPGEYDMIAVFVKSGVTSLVGTQKQIGNATMWATSCTLPECDGVLSDGMIYYRNAIPQRYQEAALWPLATGATYIMAMIQVDASGMATILAESTPFAVADSCP